MTMKDFIDRLTYAPFGSRRLDVEISAWLAREHSYFFDSALPAYTTSLDASLASERIVEVLSPDRHEEDLDRPYWRAVHQERADLFIFGYALTEPLARRVAAINALIDHA